MASKAHGSFPMPPEVTDTIVGMNSMLADMGFPRWTLIRWTVPPLYTVWLFLVLLISGLKSFAMFEIMFVVYKFFEDYGGPISSWSRSVRGRALGGGVPPARSQMDRSRSRSSHPRSSKKLASTSSYEEDYVEEESP